MSYVIYNRSGNSDWCHYDTEDEIFHEKCVPPPDPGEPGRNEKRCEQCWLIHAGECT